MNVIVLLSGTALLLFYKRNMAGDKCRTMTKFLVHRTTRGKSIEKLRYSIQARKKKKNVKIYEYNEIIKNKKRLPYIE